MSFSLRTIGRVGYVLVLGGASSLFITLAVLWAGGESLAQLVFSTLVVGMLPGLWLQLRQWEAFDQ